MVLLARRAWPESLVWSGLLLLSLLLEWLAGWCAVFAVVLVLKEQLCHTGGFGSVAELHGVGVAGKGCQAEAG